MNILQFKVQIDARSSEPQALVESCKAQRCRKSGEGPEGSALLCWRFNLMLGAESCEQFLETTKL